ncbi:MAG: ATP-dependent DNA ligase, partial [Pirellulales bacterium]|nr:ATP-dependent DNA ligase [Pirellulales bacterium]
MQRFTRLYQALDQTTRTNQKVQALVDYFRAAPAEDAAWALWFLLGNRPRSAVTRTQLRQWGGEAANLPEWLVNECYEAVGDLSETLALLLPEQLDPAMVDAARGAVDALPQVAALHGPEEVQSWLFNTALTDPAHPGGTGEAASREGPLATGAANPDLELFADERLSLAKLVGWFVLPLAGLSPARLRARVLATWQILPPAYRYLWHKLLLGGFRIGVARTLVARALAQVADLPPAVMAHRLLRRWRPTAEDYLAFLAPAGAAADLGQPYPFFLASQLDDPPAALGPVEEWQIEWKWDGIRAQLLFRQGEMLLWSRGEESILDRFPELASLRALLPEGTVLDGELLAWRGGRPLPFALLQQRITRKNVPPKLLHSAPVAFMAYDLLEWNGVDIRARSLTERRALLEELSLQIGDKTAGPGRPELPWRLSPVLAGEQWLDVENLREQARGELAEGLMLKRRAAPYSVGRTRGDWWKWKCHPWSLDCVLVAAQPGHGKRASLFTDYTFAVWDGEELVGMAKAYSGLTDGEIRQVDEFVRANTTGRFGPVRSVRPELVFELHFEGIQPSGRHRSGWALRFPRIARWRTDKTASQADTLESLVRLYEQAQRAEGN